MLKSSCENPRDFRAFLSAEEKLFLDWVECAISSDYRISHSLGLQSIGLIFTNMFLTNDAHKSKLSGLFAGSGESYWNAAELSLNIPWFFVELCQTESVSSKGAVEFARTLLLTNIEDVENLLLLQKSALFVVEAVHVVTPKYINGSEGWRMDQLEAIWTGEEPNDPGQMVDVFQVRGGVRYARSYFDTPADRLLGPILRFQIPSQ